MITKNNLGEMLLRRGSIKRKPKRASSIERAQLLEMGRKPLNPTLQEDAVEKGNLGSVTAEPTLLNRQKDRKKKKKPGLAEKARDTYKRNQNVR